MQFLLICRRVGHHSRTETTVVIDISPAWSMEKEQIKNEQKDSYILALVEPRASLISLFYHDKLDELHTNKQWLEEVGLKGTWNFLFQPGSFRRRNFEFGPKASNVSECCAHARVYTVTREYDALNTTL